MNKIFLLLCPVLWIVLLPNCGGQKLVVVTKGSMELGLDLKARARTIESIDEELNRIAYRVTQYGESSLILYLEPPILQNFDEIKAMGAQRFYDEYDKQLKAYEKQVEDLFAEREALSHKGAIIKPYALTVADFRKHFNALRDLLKTLLSTKNHFIFNKKSAELELDSGATEPSVYQMRIGFHIANSEFDESIKKSSKKIQALRFAQMRNSFEKVFEEAIQEYRAAFKEMSAEFLQQFEATLALQKTLVKDIVQIFDTAYLYQEYIDFIDQTFTSDEIEQFLIFFDSKIAEKLFNVFLNKIPQNPHLFSGWNIALIKEEIAKKPRPETERNKKLKKLTTLLYDQVPKIDTAIMNAFHVNIDHKLVEEESKKMHSPAYMEVIVRLLDEVLDNSDCDVLLNFYNLPAWKKFQTHMVELLKYDSAIKNKMILVLMFELLTEPEFKQCATIFNLKL